MTTPTVIISDLQSIVGLIQKIGPGLVEAPAAAKITADTGIALQVLGAITGATPPDQSASVLTVVESYVNDALSVLPAFLPPPYSMYVAAAAVLLKTLEAFIDTVAPNVNPVTPMPSPAAGKMGEMHDDMTPEEARIHIATGLSA